MPQRNSEERSIAHTGAGQSREQWFGQSLGQSFGQSFGQLGGHARAGILLGCAAAACALGGCDPRPTMKLHLLNIPAGTDSLQTSVWLRTPTPGSPNTWQIQEYGGPGYHDQIITPRTTLSDRASVGLELEESRRNSAVSEDTSVVVVVLARVGTQLMGRGVGQSLFTAAEPLFPDVIDVPLMDPLPQYSPDDPARAAVRGYSDIRSTCSLTNDDTLPELTVEGWGFPTTVIARFEEAVASGADMGTETQTPDVIEQPYLADSSAQIRIKFDKNVTTFSPPLLKLTLSFKNSDGSTTEFYSLPQVQATCPKGLPPMVMSGGSR